MSGPDAWLERNAGLAEVAARQIFLLDGQPRSGTTWLQSLLDAHPEVSCRGEAAFGDHLAAPLTVMMRARRQELEQRNRTIFAHQGGYPPPTGEDVRHLFGTAMLLGLHRQLSGRSGVRAVGEKTPGNIALFDEMRLLFPQGRMIGIARDPRDVIASNWHRFQAGPHSTRADKARFVASVLPEADRWLRAMLDLGTRRPEAFRIVTYEQLHAAPAPALSGLFGFLGVSRDAEVVARCIGACGFEQQSGRPAGVARNGEFFRLGVAGGWRDTLDPAMERMVLDALGWSFPLLGWTP